MKEKLLHERALVTCIAMLFICIILKLFGVQWFNLNTDIPILQEIDKVVMNSVPLSFLYSFIMLSINSYLVCIMTLKRPHIKILPFSTMMVLNIILSYLFKGNNLLFLLDTIMMWVICVYEYKSLFITKEYILVFMLNILYQMTSLFIKNMGCQLSYYGLVHSVLLNIDYYIMSIITYLYFIKGGETLCSISHRFGSSLAAKLWKKRSENYSNKEGN